MSSDTPDRPQDEAHEGPIKTTGQLAWVVVLSFVVPIVLILLLVNFVVVGDRPAAGTDAFSERAIAQRLQPQARVAFADPAAAEQFSEQAVVERPPPAVAGVEPIPAPTPVTVRSGQQVYTAACMVCHAAGVAGAPRSGDIAAWAPRIRTGFEAMLNSTLNGKGAMPPQRGPRFSDHEIALAVVFMANQAGGNLPEPPAPVAAAR